MQNSGGTAMDFEVSFPTHILLLNVMLDLGWKIMIKEKESRKPFEMDKRLVRISFEISSDVFDKWDSEFAKYIPYKRQ